MQADLILIRFIFIVILVVAGFLLHPVPGPRYVSGVSSGCQSSTLFPSQSLIQAKRP